MRTKETTAIIWFTGVISQYNVANCDIPNLVINFKLLDKIIKNYSADKYIALINVRNELEKEQYLDLIKRNDLQKTLVFVFCDMYDQCLSIIGTLRYSYNIVYYIDCSRKRLVDSVGMIEPQKLIHISQLLE